VRQLSLDPRLAPQARRRRHRQQPEFHRQAGHVQRFRIRGLDLASLRSSGPQSLAFSVGGNGGPQLSVNIDPDQTDEEIAAAIDRALAPMGVNAGLDGQGGFVFSTPEANWPAVKDSIAISGRGRVATEEVPAELVPQQWPANGGMATPCVRACAKWCRRWNACAVRATPPAAHCRPPRWK
jgi:hypothetical protein